MGQQYAAACAGRVRYMTIYLVAIFHKDPGPLGVPYDSKDLSLQALVLPSDDLHSVPAQDVPSVPLEHGLHRPERFAWHGHRTDAVVKESMQSA